MAIRSYEDAKKRVEQKIPYFIGHRRTIYYSCLRKDDEEIFMKDIVLRVV